MTQFKSKLPYTVNFRKEISSVIANFRDTSIIKVANQVSVSTNCTIR